MMAGRYDYLATPSALSLAAEAQLLRSRHEYFPLNVALKSLGKRTGHEAALHILRVLRKYGGHISGYEDNTTDWAEFFVCALGKAAEKRYGAAALRAVIRETGRQRGWLVLPCRHVDDVWVPDLAKMVRKFA